MSIREHVRMLVKAEDTIRHVIGIIDAAATQIALVVDEAGHLLGTVTDGDVRRGILKGLSLDEQIQGVMNTHPVTARMGTPQDELMAVMTSRYVKQVPLLDEDGRVLGLERLDNLLQKASVKENPAVILAGGHGTRLRPLTSRTPKPLLQVGGKPVMELILQQLRGYGFHRLFISVNYLGDQIEESFGDGRRHRVSIQYLREPKPLGTAGPLALLPKPLHLPCIVVNGDLVTKVNFEHMLEFHQEGGFNLTIGVKEYAIQLPFGVVVTEADRVVQFREKPEETRLINAGVCIIDPDVVDMVSSETHYDMNQLIEQVLCQPEGKVGAFPIHEYWLDIGTAADYRKAQWDYPVHFGE